MDTLVVFQKACGIIPFLVLLIQKAFPVSQVRRESRPLPVRGLLSRQAAPEGGERAQFSLNLGTLLLHLK